MGFDLQTKSRVYYKRMRFLIKYETIGRLVQLLGLQVNFGAP
jgi:hypothetical protein